MKRAIRGAFRITAVATLYGATLAACATNPVTGRRQLALISESQEIQMGRQGSTEVEQSIGLVQDQALQDYVQRVGATMASVSERPQLPWQFRVLDDPQPNAFALPGGYIYITRGLLGLMDSEAELASVLGHEIAHVTARHSVSMISRAQLTQLGMGLGMVLFPSLARFGDLAGTGMQLLFLRYGRDAERQSDELGFGYALRQGYAVAEMAEVFAKLDRAGDETGRSALPSWLSTHPAEPERIRAVQQRLASVPTEQATRTEREPFLTRIDGMVFGDDPRQGFFRDGLFLHPELRFQMAFPTGWRTQNLPQSVTAMSPQQDGAIQLTLARSPSADAAAQQFFASQAVRPGYVSRQDVHGKRAVVGSFQAQTQQGIIAGVAGFIEHRGTVYQVLTMSPSGSFRRYEGLFRQVINSFAEVNDPSVLNVRPNRLDVVRLPRAMTLADFHRAYPSVVPLEQIALINGVENAATVLPSGMLVKRVVTGG